MKILTNKDITEPGQYIHRQQEGFEWALVEFDKDMNHEYKSVYSDWRKKHISEYTEREWLKLP